MTRTAAAKIQLRCTVNDVEFQVVSFNTSFESNSIPSAQILVPVGRNSETDAAAKIHANVRKFKISDPVKVFMKVFTAPGPNEEDWPNGEVLIFDGFLAGTGFRKNVSQVSYVLHVRHWLVQLTYSSCLSADSHPMNPAQMTFASITPARAATGGGTFGVNGILPYGFDSGIADAITSEGDIWGEALLPWLKSTAEVNQFDSYDPLLADFALEGRPNTSALKALEKFSIAGDYQPLILDMEALDSETVAQAIEMAIQDTTYMSFANTTFWNKIVRDFGANYLFSVVPRIEDAYVVPALGGTRKDFNVSITADEYASIDLGAHLEHRLHGVGILAAGASLSGVFANEVGIGGWYAPDDDAEGMVMVRSGPAWLQHALIPAGFAGQSSAPRGVVATAAQPGAGNAGTQPNMATRGRTIKNLLDRYAESVYVHEALKSRQGSLTGKLRFDIAPGSIVRIEVAGDAFVPKDRLGEALFANIIRVTISIDANAQKAFTSFNLSHVRTEDENTEAGMSVDRHPLYDAVWTGTSLSDEFN